MRREREAAKAREQAEAANKAAAIWKAAKPAPEDFSYLIRKSNKPNGARLHNDALVIPMRADGEIHSLQFIGPEGDKRFLTGGRVTGCYFSIGNPKGAVALCIAEGFATGATIHEATGYPVAVAFNAGNLAAVAKAMRERFRELPLILCADDDVATEGNPGKTKATEAARAVGGLVTVPSFGDNRPEGVSDFNDMAALHGMEAVKQAVANAAAPVRREHQPSGDDVQARDPASREWQEPEPLGVTCDRAPYPIDALPQALRLAVEEVQTFVQAPAALVACSALAALSAAAQGLANVRRDAQLAGPVSTYILSVADSGERKTSCDEFFSRAILTWERETAAVMAPEVARAAAEHSAFHAKRGGIEDAIKRGARTGKDTSSFEQTLRTLIANAPKAVIVPRQMFADATQEALAYELARGWPCGAMISAEAGAILGGYAMSADSLMRNLALLNVLWDGGELRIDRRTKESFTIRGRRLTFGVMIQELTLRDFIERARGLARGTGFLARFLICWPASTQGIRAYRQAPECMPALDAFSSRIRALLDEHPQIDERGDLAPPELHLSAAARARWITFHDDVEAELSDRGDLRDLRDVASKSAENVARVAALLHILQRGPSGEIGEGEIVSAGRIVAWHLGEAQRLLGALDAPKALANAIKLDAWLRAEARRTSTNLVPTREIRRLGPYAVRQDADLCAALGELAVRHRARFLSSGKRRYIEVNPAILAEGTQT